MNTPFSFYIEARQICYHVSKHQSHDREHGTTDSPLKILNNIDLNIKRGSSVAIVGASGSGKSSLLGILAGLDVPSSGEIYIDGTEITGLNEERRAAFRGDYVAFVFQNFQLLPTFSSLENVSLPLEIKGDKQSEQKAKHYLNEFGLGHRLHHLPNQLSGGEQQRVALARAFACDAPIIFADEPTGNLDSETGNKITDLLFEKNKQKETTLILVTHSNDLAQRCDEKYEMKGGILSHLHQ